MPPPGAPVPRPPPHPPSPVPPPRPGPRPPSGRARGGGEAIAADVYVIALMFWAYGVVPHQFLTWANNELNWTAANQLKGWGDFLVNWPYISTIKFSHETLSHTIVAGIYGFFLTAHVA